MKKNAASANTPENLKLLATRFAYDMLDNVDNNKSPLDGYSISHVRYKIDSCCDDLLFASVEITLFHNDHLFRIDTGTGLLTVYDNQYMLGKYECSMFIEAREAINAEYKARIENRLG